MVGSTPRWFCRPQWMPPDRPVASVQFRRRCFARPTSPIDGIETHLSRYPGGCHDPCDGPGDMREVGWNNSCQSGEAASESQPDGLVPIRQWPVSGATRSCRGFRRRSLHRPICGSADLAHRGLSTSGFLISLPTPCQAAREGKLEGGGGHESGPGLGKVLVEILGETPASSQPGEVRSTTQRRGSAAHFGSASE